MGRRQARCRDGLARCRSALVGSPWCFGQEIDSDCGYGCDLWLRSHGLYRDWGCRAVFHCGAASLEKPSG